MSWCALEVRTPPELRERVAAWLVQRTAQAVEEKDDGTLVTIAQHEDAAMETVAAMRAAFAGARLEVALRDIAEADWSLRWRDGIEAREFGRLIVGPSWLEVVPGPGQVAIVIDPEMAFGSGEHGSTRAALRLLERHLHEGDTVLDLGSGSGILSVAAVRLGARRAIGIEADLGSIPVAEENARRNFAAERIAFVEGDAGVLAPLLGPAQVVCSNILRSINEVILPEVAAALAPGGIAIFSGMEERERPLFLEALGEAWTLRDEVVDAGWWACGVTPRRG